MGIIIVLGLLLLVAVGGLAWALLGKSWTAAAVGAVALILDLVIFLFLGFTSVGPSDVGIVTSFGHLDGDLTPGLHFVAPWKNVTIWDHSVRTISYGRNPNQSAPDHCLQVRIGGQQSACLALTFQYRVVPGSADRLFKLYRTQGNMEANLVTTALDQAVYTQLKTFSPIQAVAAGNASGASLAPYEPLITQQITTEIGNVIQIVRLFIPYPQYDPQTTNRLNAIQTQIADTLIARQAVLTAIQQAKAIAILQKQLSASANSSAVVANLCYTNVVVPMIKQGMNPAGVSCWPDSGGGSTVVIPAGAHG